LLPGSFQMLPIATQTQPSHHTINLKRNLKANFKAKKQHVDRITQTRIIIANCEVVWIHGKFFFDYLHKKKYSGTDLYRYFFDSLLTKNKDELIGVAFEIIKNNKKLLFESIKKVLNLEETEKAQKIFRKIYELDVMSLDNGRTVHVFESLFFPDSGQTSLIEILQDGTVKSNNLFSYLLNEEIISALNLNKFKIKLKWNKSTKRSLLKKLQVQKEIVK
jgi:hypothetical protein